MNCISKPHDAQQATSERPSEDGRADKEMTDQRPAGTGSEQGADRPRAAEAARSRLRRRSSDPIISIIRVP